MPAPPPSFADRHVSGRLGRCFERYQARWGRWFVYLRRDPHFPCACRTGDSEEGDAGCRLCFGLGYAARAERLHGFLSAPENVSSLVTTVNVGDWGRLDQYPSVLYVPRAYQPAAMDVVLEVEWDLPTESVALYGRPTRLVRAWHLTVLIPSIFNQDSQVDFYLCGLEQRTLSEPELWETLRTVPLLAPQRGSLPGGQPYQTTPGYDGVGTYAPQKEGTGRRARTGLGRAARQAHRGL